MQHLVSTNTYGQSAVAYAGRLDRLARRGYLRNCLGLWLPCAGCTGNILWDYSGNGNHASFLGTNRLTWGTSEYGPTIVGTNNGDQRLTLDRTITIAAGEEVTCWIYHYNTSGDSIWFGEDSRTSFLVRLGTTIYSRTTTNLETLSSNPGTGAWMSFTMDRDEDNNVLYTKNGDNFGNEVAHTGIFNIQHIMNLAADDMALNGQLIACGVWARKLSQAQLRELYHMPCLIGQQDVVWPAIASGGGGGAVPSPRTNIQGPLVGPFGGPVA